MSQKTEIFTLCLFQEAKAKQQQVSDLNAAIEELKRTVATKEEELSQTKQLLDMMNKQTEELQSQFMLIEQKYKDQHSKNLGNILSDRFPSTISFRLCVQIFQSCKPT
jgi:chromosome segregation ATPase